MGLNLELSCQAALKFYKKGFENQSRAIAKYEPGALDFLLEFEKLGYTKILQQEKHLGLEILKSVCLAYAETSQLNKALHLISVIRPFHANFRSIVPRIADLYGQASPHLIMPGKDYAPEIKDYLARQKQESPALPSLADKALLRFLKKFYLSEVFSGQTVHYHPFFSTCAPKHITEILEEIEHKYYQSHDLILKHRENNAFERYLYIIALGGVSISKVVETGEEKVFNVYKENGLFGHFQIFTFLPTPYNFRAISDTQLILIPNRTLKTLQQKYADFSRHLYFFSKNSYVHGVFEASAITKALPSGLKFSISSETEMLTVFRKETLLKAGDPYKGIYILHHGGLGLFHEGELVRKIYPAEFFGSFALYDEPTCPFNIVALAYSVCYLIRSHIFFRELAGNPRVFYQLKPHIRGGILQIQESQEIKLLPEVI